jgi:tRNA pseudouridine38-40 synthase
MDTWKLTLEYDGTRYAGWQEQRNATTVQGVLRAAAEAHLGERVELGGAGRTDAGVHAIGQVAHLRTNARAKARSLLYGLNDGLPPDVNVLSVDPAPSRFHARRDAVLRSYVYQISTRRTAFGKRYVWWVKDALDADSMARAAGVFVGRHDFSAFAQRGEPGASTAVVVDESRVERRGDLLLFRVAASHFLWKMVRRLAGSLVAVGRGDLDESDLERLLEAAEGDSAASLTAPPSGLFLEQVLYARRDPRRPLEAALGVVF